MEQSSINEKSLARAAFEVNSAYFDDSSHPEKKQQNTVAVILLEAGTKIDDVKLKKDTLCAVSQRYYTKNDQACREIGTKILGQEIEYMTSPDSTDKQNIHAEQLAFQEFDGYIKLIGINKPPCGSENKNCLKLLKNKGVPYGYCIVEKGEITDYGFGP
jgi:hypothetical protein